MLRGPSSRSTIVTRVTPARVKHTAFALVALALWLRSSGIGFGIALDQGGVGAWKASLLWPALNTPADSHAPLHRFLLTSLNGLCFGIAKLIGVASELDYRAFLETLPGLRSLMDRSVSVIAATGTVWILIRFGRDLAGGSASALLAGGFLAIAPLHVRLAHYGTADTFFALLATGALLAIVAVAQRRADQPPLGGRRSWPRAAALGLAAAATTLVATEFTSSTRALVEKPPAAAPLEPLLELGWGFLLLGGLGLASLARAQPLSALLVAALPAGALLIASSSGDAPSFALVSIVPILLLLAARGCTIPFRRLQPRPALAAAALAALISVAEVAPALAKLHRIYHTPDSRLVAAQWIADAFPKGATVTVEPIAAPREGSATSAGFNLLVATQTTAPHSKPSSTLVARFPSIPGAGPNHHPEISVYRISEHPPRRGADADGYFPHDGGKSYIMDIPPDVASDGPNRRGVSRLALLEDGVPLGQAHQGHEAIRREGKGRYSHWKGRVFFSTSDGTNPNTNGYDYTWIDMK